MPWLLRMTILVSGIMLPAHLYLGWRLTKAFEFAGNSKFIKFIPIGLLASFYTLPVSGLLLFLVQENFELLEFYQPVTYWFWFGFVFTFQLLTWIVICDVLKLISHRILEYDRQRINRVYGWVTVVTMLSVAVYTGTKMYWDTTGITTQEIELKVSNLPQNMEGLRLVHISDIQGDEYTGREEISQYVKKVNALQPDVVVITGDLISYGTEFIEMSTRELGNIQASYGTFAVVGDHDYWAGLSYVEPALENQGIPLLRDENKLLVIEEDSLLLTGITQVYSKRADPEKVKELTAAFSEVNVKVLASHQASELLIDQAVEHRYGLLLAGHTHGGQIRVPFFGMRFSASDLETEFINGQYWVENLLINVNSGLGFTLAPVRYNAPPSITVIKLTGEGRNQDQQKAPLAG